MKTRSRIIAVLGILILCAGLFVACNSEVSESSAVDTSKTAYLSFGNGLSKAIDATSIGQEYEIISVNDVYWLYTATKKDNAGTTGAKTDMTPVKSDFTKGLDGVIGPMSVGKWEFKLEGYKAVEDSAPSSGSYKEVTIGQVTKYYWASEKIYDGSSAIITLSENTASNPQVVSVDIVFAGIGDGTIVIRTGEFYWVDDNGGDVALDNNMFRIHLTLSQDSVEKYDVYFNLIAESYSVGTETKTRYTLANEINSFNAASGDYDATFAVEKWSVEDSAPVARVGYVSGASDVSVTVYAQQILDIDSQFLESVFGYVTFDGITPSPVLVQRLVLKTDTTSLTVSETQTITHDGLSVTYPDGTKLSEGTKEAEDGKTADATTGFVYTSSEPSSGSVVVGNDDAVMQYALTLNVDVTNTTVLTVTKNIGTGRDIQSVYHNGNLMTIASGSGDPVADTYSYNSATGILTLYVNHASPIDVVYRPAVSTDVAKIVRSEKTYLFASLEEAVADAQANETVILLNDTNADVTVDKVITIDLNGKNYGGTITVATTGTNAVTVIGDANVDAMVKIGNRYFNAFVRANNSTTTLLKDITISEQQTVSVNGSFDYDLNGHTLTFSADNSQGAVYLPNNYQDYQGARLSIRNGNLNFTATGSSSVGIFVYGELNLTDVNITSCGKYAIEVQPDAYYGKGIVNIVRGSITSSNYAVYALAANDKYPTVQLTDVSVYGEGSNEPLVAYGAKMDISGCIVESANNAAVLVTGSSAIGGSKSVVTINSGTFDGAISKDTGHTLIVKGGRFKENPSSIVNTAVYDITESEGYFIVTLDEARVVTSIDGVYYGSVEQAIEECPNAGKTIVLEKDSSENIVVSQMADFTLDTSNHSFVGSIVAGEGYNLTVTDNHYVITPPPQAQIGTNNYLTLGAAIDAILKGQESSGSTIILLSDTEEETIQISKPSSAKEFVIQTGDYAINTTIQAPSGWTYIYVFVNNSYETSISNGNTYSLALLGNKTVKLQ